MRPGAQTYPTRPITVIVPYAVGSVLLPYVGLALGPGLDGLFDLLRQTEGKNVRGLGVRLEICHHDQDVLRLQRDDCT